MYVAQFLVLHQPISISFSVVFNASQTVAMVDPLINVLPENTRPGPRALG